MTKEQLRTLVKAEGFADVTLVAELKMEGYQLQVMPVINEEDPSMFQEVKMLSAPGEDISEATEYVFNEMELEW